MKVHKCGALATIASIYVVYAITTNDRNGNGHDNQMCIYAMSAVVAEGKRNRENENENERKKIHSHRDFNAYIHWLQPTPIYILQHSAILTPISAGAIITTQSFSTTTIK